MTTHISAFRSELKPSDVVKGHIEGPAFDVQMHLTQWPEHGQGVFESSIFFVRMVLSESMEMKGTYASNACPNDYAALGEVAFIPEHYPLYCTWTSGAQRSISCMFDIGILSQRVAVDWSWPSFDPEAALSIRNEYVHLGMRRIAEEVLSPGFASATQVECSLMFVALALRRHLEGNRQTGRTRNGRLTERQLDLMHSMVVDTPGAPPTIAELAATCGMGGRQLALSYRRTTGITLRSFIANGRLDRAKILLLDGRTLIKQIAFDSGFRSSAAFAAAFRKGTGMTPVDFRTSMGAQRLY
jgi:AraC family transcriptional regulator